MKIHGQYSKLHPQENQNQKTKEAKTSTENSKINDLKGENPEKSLTIDKLRETLNLQSDIDIEKVKALKAKIKNGSYQVEPDKIAHTMLHELLIDQEDNKWN